MAVLIQGSTIATVWYDLLKELKRIGSVTSPRDATTLEIMNVTVEVSKGLNNVLVSPSRNLNYRFMIAEWLWIQAGLNEVDTIAKYNSNMKLFSDDGEILSGAYGPRLRPQMNYIRNTLGYRATRQAVATIWTPSPQNSKDIPCTISLQWFVRKNLLHCTVNMRSSDVWLGLPYDFFTFSQLTNQLAASIGIEVGSITMNLGSSHLYETNWNAADEVLERDDCSTVPSPLLPRTEVSPSPENIDWFLRYPPSPETVEASVGPQSIFAKYLGALSTNKERALEVLRALAASK